MAMDHERRIESIFSSLCSLFYIGARNHRWMVTRCVEIATKFSKDVYGYNMSQGIWRPDGGLVKNGDIDPIEMMNRILDLSQTSLSANRKIFLLEHFDILIENRDPLLLTKLRLIIDNGRHNYTVVLMGRPYFPLPEIISDIPRVNEPSLDPGDIRSILKACDKDLLEEDSKKLTGTLRGLTSLECENLLSLSLVRCGRPDISFIQEEKAALLHDRAGGLIDVCRTGTSLDHVGGMGVLKDWLTKRGGFFHGNALNERKKRLPTPKGVLLTGPPGCGKSFVASALAGSWGIHLVKLATSRLFSSLVGESEQNLLTALETVQALSPCILWVEEFEKFFPGTSSIASDGGVLSRVLGIFLDYLQSERNGVFVCATTNSIHALPMEIMRAGRFDAVFWIDLPNREERKAIFEVLFKRYGIEDRLDASDPLLDMTETFSGAEIEQSLIDSFYDCTEQEPTELDFLRTLKGMVPLAKTMGEQVSGMREWCLSRTRPASTPAHSSRKEKRKPCRISHR
jgi:hypothetical protein